MINVAGIDWSKVTKAGVATPPKFAPKGVTTFMQPPKQSVNLKKFIPQVAPKEEYISPYMELNKPISPEQKQVVMALGANIKKGDDLATIRQKFPEIADIGDKSLQALRANIMKGDSPEMIEKKFPELQWIKTKQTDDKYKYNIMNKPTQFLQGLREKAENIDIPVVEPLAKGVLGTAMLGTKGMRDVIQGGAGLLDKGIAGATGTDKVYKSGVAEDVFDVAQGSSNTLASVVAPVSVTALGTVMSALPKPVQQSVGDIFQNIGGFIAKTPGLKQWKESLPPERRAEFDNEVMGGLTALFFGAKNKLNLLKNPKAFVQENILNPQNVVKNIEQNVLNVPGRIKNIPTGARNTADWVISTELPRGKWRDKFYKMTGKTPEKYIGDMGVKGLDAEGLAKLEESRDFAKGQADEGLSEIKGNYRYRPIEYTKSDGTKVEYVGDAIRDMLEDIIDKKPKNTTEVDKYREYLRKYDDEGLSQTEINTAKREFERSNRFNYLRENNIDRYNRATNVDSAVREWQYKVAESRGLDLKSVNKQTQAIKTLIDKLGGDAPEMKGFNLSDWLIAGNMTPEAIALLVGKKIADSKYIKNKIVSALNIGRKTGLKKINKSALEASQRKVDIERYLYDKFGKNDVPSSDIYGLPVRSNNKPGLPRQVESPTNVYKPRTDVVTPTGKVIPSKFKKVIEVGEATQPGTTKLDTQVVKLEGQENMPKMLPNTNLPKKMPKSPKPQEKQAIVEGIKSSKKVTLDDLYIRARGKTYDEFLRDISKDDLFREQYIDAFSKSVDEKILKVKEMLSESGLPQGTIDAVIKDLKEIDTKVLGNMDNKTSRSIVEKVFEIKLPNTRKGTKEAIDKIYRLDSFREQANKKGLPVKETQPTKQVPEAKNIEEDLLAEARKAVDIFVDELGLTKAEAQQEVSDMVKYSMTIEDLKDFDDFMGIYENNIHKLARDKGKQYDIDKFIPQLRKIREQANKKGLPVKETQAILEGEKQVITRGKNQGMPKDWKKMTDDELLEYYESEQGLKEQKKLEEVIMRRISKGDEMIGLKEKYKKEIIALNKQEQGVGQGKTFKNLPLGLRRNTYKKTQTDKWVAKRERIIERISEDFGLDQFEASDLFDELDNA